MSGPTPGPEPLLLLEGRGKATSTRAGLIGQWIAVAGALYYITFFLSDGLLPGVATPTLETLPLFFGPAVLASATVGWSLWRGRRTGRFAFFDDRVVVTRFGAHATLSWSEVKGFRDDANDVVELVTGGTRASVFVPTTDEPSRVSLLALLDGKKVPRHE